MRCLGRIIGIILILVIMVIAPCAIWTFAFWNVGTDAEAYTDSLDDQAYEQMVLLVVPGIAELIRETETGGRSQEAGVLADVITNMESDEWEAIASDLLDPEWLRETINANLDNISAFGRFETDELIIHVDVEPIALALDENHQELITGIMQNIDNWDSCTNAQRTQLIEYINGQNSEFVACNPGISSQSQVRDALSSSIDAILSRLQEVRDYEFDLRTEAAKDTDGGLAEVDENLNDMRRGLFFIDRTIVVLLLIPIMLLSLIVVVAVRSAKEFFFWMGLPLIGAGLATTVPLFPWIYGMAYGHNSAPGFIKDPEVELGFHFQRWLFSAFAQPIGIAILSMLAVGFIFIVIAAALKGPREEQQVFYMVPGAHGTPPVPVMPQQPPMPQPVIQQPVVRQSITPQPVTTPPLPRSAPEPKPRVTTPQPAAPPVYPPGQYVQTGTEPSESGPNPMQIIVPKRIDDPGSASTSDDKPESAADHHRAALDTPDLANDRTFIPPDGTGSGVPPQDDTEDASDSTNLDAC